MRITFLGTGTSQGVPVISCRCEVCTSPDPHDNRLRSSVMVEENGRVLVIDAGPDFRQQMLQHQVMRLDAVLLTHGHKDHIGGLDDIRAFNFIQRKAIDVYARKDVHESLEREFSYAFAKEKYPGVPEINLHRVENTAFTLFHFHIQPIEVLHFKLPVLGFRIGKFAYITDASYISTESMNLLYNLDILVINGLRKRKHYSHFNLEEALQVIDTVQPKTAFITHISHLMGTHASVQASLPEHVFLAFDNQVLEM